MINKITRTVLTIMFLVVLSAITFIIFWFAEDNWQEILLLVLMILVIYPAGWLTHYFATYVSSAIQEKVGILDCIMMFSGFWLAFVLIPFVRICGNNE